MRRELVVDSIPVVVDPIPQGPFNQWKLRIIAEAVNRSVHESTILRENFKRENERTDNKLEQELGQELSRWLLKNYLPSSTGPSELRARNFGRR